MDEFIKWLEKEIEENGAAARTPRGYNAFNGGAEFALRRALSRANTLRDAIAQGNKSQANEPEDGGLVDCDSE